MTSSTDSKKNKPLFFRGEHDWPTGSYLSNCVKCGTLFMGEKRQRLCLKCIPKKKD